MISIKKGVFLKNKIISIIQTNYSCNLDCSYCYVDNCKKLLPPMSNDTLEEIIYKSFISDIDHVDFVWHGGEPLLMNDDFFKKVIKFQNKYNKKGISFSNKIQTNGTLLFKKRYDFLRENFEIGISLDGVKEVHDKYRKNHNGIGSFDIIKKNIEDINDKNIGFVATFSDSIIGFEKESYDLWKKYSNGVKFNFVSPTKEDIKKTMLSPKEASDVLLNFYKILKEDNPKKFILNPMKSIILSFILNYNPICQFNRQACSNVFSISPDGNITLCGKSDDKLYHISEIESILDYKKSENFELLEKKRNILKESCCKYWEKCYGGCPHESNFIENDFLEKTYYCESRKKLFQTIEKDLKERGLINDI